MASNLRLMFFCFAPMVCTFVGCTRDNPAFDRDDVADGDADATSAETNGESSDSATSMSSNDGDGDPSTTNGDGDGDPSTTNGDGDGDFNCALGSGCPACHACDNESGECVPDVGAPCGGAPLHCAEYLYGSEGGVCYRLADVVINAQCDDSGECKEPEPSACPPQQGQPLFQCDVGCVTSAEACAVHAPASSVELGDMCVVNGPGPDCRQECFNEMGSNILNHACDNGLCVYLGIEEHCNPFACNEETASCYEQCGNDSHCAVQYFCALGMCIG